MMKAGSKQMPKIVLFAVMPLSINFAGEQVALRETGFQMKMNVTMVLTQSIGFMSSLGAMASVIGELHMRL